MPTDPMAQNIVSKVLVNTWPHPPLTTHCTFFSFACRDISTYLSFHPDLSLSHSHSLTHSLTLSLWLLIGYHTYHKEQRAHVSSSCAEYAVGFTFDLTLPSLLECLKLWLPAAEPFLYTE